MLYVSTSCLQKRMISEVICKLAENGIKNIELSGGTDYYPMIEQDLKNLKEKSNLQYACHAYFPPPKEPFVVNLASCNDRIYKRSIEHYELCIEMMCRLGCRTLSVHAGFLVEINESEIGGKLGRNVVYDEKEAYERFCTAFNYIQKLCTTNSIKLFLENNVLSAENYQQFNYHNYMMMTDYRSIMKMKEMLDFSLLLDLGHLYVSTNTLGLDYTKECDKLKEFVKWIHISENNGIFDEHKPLLEGSQILSEFNKLYHSDINVTLETMGNIEDIVRSADLMENMHF